MKDLHNPHSPDPWHDRLTPEQYRIVRGKETEAPFSGVYLDNHENGMYHCVACGHELFSSDSKFDSGSGWPSFCDPVTSANIQLVPDESLGMLRTEVSCAHCGAHLGHLFDDGPEEKGGMRYCINSLALNFMAAPNESKPADA